MLGKKPTKISRQRMSRSAKIRMQTVPMPSRLHQHQPEDAKKKIGESSTVRAARRIEDHVQTTPYEQLSAYFRKKIQLDECGHKCTKCGQGEVW